MNFLVVMQTCGGGDRIFKLGTFGDRPVGDFAPLFEQFWLVYCGGEAKSRNGFYILICGGFVSKLL